MRHRYRSEYGQRLFLVALIASSLWERRPLTSFRHRRLAVSERALEVRLRERALDRLLRDAARQSLASAPPSFTDSVRLTLSRSASDAPPAPISPASRPLAAFWASPPAFAFAGQRPDQQRRAALRQVGALVLVLAVGGLTVALDPGEVFTALGIASALLLSAVALGHMLAAAVGAVMGGTLVALAACALYMALAVLWIRLVRTPVEA